jgi:hypothetical protein
MVNPRHETPPSVEAGFEQGCGIRSDTVSG